MTMSDYDRGIRDATNGVQPTLAEARITQYRSGYRTEMDRLDIRNATLENITCAAMACGEYLPPEFETWWKYGYDSGFQASKSV